MRIFKENKKEITWPISESFLIRLGLLAYTDKINLNGKKHIEWAAEFVEKSKIINESPDSNFVFWDKERYKVFSNENQDITKYIESIEDRKVQHLYTFLRKDEYFKNDKNRERVNKDFNSSFFLEKLICDSFKFHRVLPRNGIDFFRWMTWEISLITGFYNSYFDRIRKDSMFVLESFKSTCVRIYHYPVESEIVWDTDITAFVHSHHRYGHEVFINGPFLLAVEDIILLFCKKKEINPESQEEKNSYQGNSSKLRYNIDLQYRVGNIGDIINAKDRYELSSRIVAMPLDEDSLRQASIMRFLSITWIIFHEESHIRQGHLAEYVHKNGSKETSSIKSEFNNDKFKSINSSLSEEELSEISIIKELQADANSIDNLLEYLADSVLVHSLDEDSEKSIEKFIELLFNSILSTFIVFSLHEKNIESDIYLYPSHPSPDLRIFSLLLHLRSYCNSIYLKKNSIDYFESTSRKWNQKTKFSLVIESKFDELIRILMIKIKCFDESYNTSLFSKEIETALSQDISIILNANKGGTSDLINSTLSSIGIDYLKICSNFHNIWLKDLIKEKMHALLNIAYSNMTSRSR